MTAFRKVLFWLHLISGVLAGIFIFLMCVTGAMLSFQANILEFVERDMRNVRPASADAKPLAASELLGRVQTSKPNSKPSALTIQNNPNAAYVVAFGREGQAFVNPYTAEITGEGAKNWRGFFRTTEDVHRWLALPGSGRDVGKSINDVSNLLFLFLAISGFYIWFPRQWTRKHFAPILWFRKTSSAKARDFNWHNVIGFWTSSVLIILTLTGAIISYQWAGNLLYTLTGNELPPPPQQQGPPPGNQAAAQPTELPANLDALIDAASARGSWKSIALRLPVTNDSAVFTIDEGIYANPFGRSTLTLRASDASIAKWEAYGEQNAARQLRSWARFTHTGESFGIIGQIIGFIACIGGAVLVYTGIALALRRLSAWRRRSSAANVEN